MITCLSLWLPERPSLHLMGHSVRVSERRAWKLGMINCNIEENYGHWFNKQCIMPRPTPQMLRKSGINKGNAMKYKAFIVRIVHVCVEKQSAVACTCCGQLNNRRSPPQSLPLPYRLPYFQKYVFIFRPNAVYFCLIYFCKFNFT